MANGQTYGERRAAAVGKLAEMPIATLCELVHDSLSAMVMHHVAKAAELRAVITGCMECGCQGCTNNMPEMLNVLAEFERDTAVLNAAGSMIAEAGGEFDPADPAFIAAELEHLAGIFQQADQAQRPEIKALNRLLDQPCLERDDDAE